MQTINIGIIGTGSIVREQLLPAVQTIPHARVWSVLSRDAARAQLLAAAFHAAAPCATHTSLETFLADTELHAVIIATPDQSHAAQTIAALEAGKHVFVEKPMCTTREDAQRITACAAQTNRIVQVGYHLRFHGAHQWVKHALDTRRFGAIRRIRMDWSYTMTPDSTPWRAAGTDGAWWVMAALGTHAIDLAHWFLGEDTIARIHAHTTNTQFGLRDEQALISFTSARGVIGELFVSNLTRRVRVIELNTEHADIMLHETLGARAGGSLRVNNEEIPFPVQNPYAVQLTAFVQAISHNRPASPDAHVGALNVELLLQSMKESAVS